VPYAEPKGAGDKRDRASAAAELEPRHDRGGAERWRVGPALEPDRGPIHYGRRY
jgi:hypothetical protein